MSPTEKLFHHTFKPWTDLRYTPAVSTAGEAVRLWAQRTARKNMRERVLITAPGDVLAPPAGDILPHQSQHWGAMKELWRLVEATSVVCAACGGARCGPGLGPRMPACYRRSSCWTAGAGGLDWVLGTAHPGRWDDVPKDVRSKVVLLVSASTQPEVDARVGKLLAADGFRLRAVLLEPLCEAVNLRQVRHRGEDTRVPVCALTGGWAVPRNDGTHRQEPRVHWVVAGAAARGVSEASWFQQLAQQCSLTNTPCWFTRLGGRLSTAEGPVNLSHGGSLVAQWPAGLQVQQLPQALKEAFHG